MLQYRARMKRVRWAEDGQEGAAHPLAIDVGSRYVATVALTFRIAGPSFKPLLLHARFAGSPAATVAPKSRMLSFCHRQPNSSRAPPGGLIISSCGSRLRPPVPQTGALTGRRYAPPGQVACGVCFWPLPARHHTVDRCRALNPTGGGRVLRASGAGP
jgi:hypothetical protein